MFDREARPQLLDLRCAALVVGEHDGPRGELAHVPTVHQDQERAGQAPEAHGAGKTGPVRKLERTSKIGWQFPVLGNAERGNRHPLFQ